MKRKNKKKKSLKVLHDELKKLCSAANDVSLFHLAVAIFSGHHSYLTNEIAILSKKDSIYRRYKIVASDSLHECSDSSGTLRKKQPWEFYL
jgi:hypothetical protein